MFVRLFVCSSVRCLQSRSKLFRSYADLTIACEGLETVCSVPIVFEQGMFSTMRHLLYYGTSVLRSRPKDLPYLVAILDNYVALATNLT